MLKNRIALILKIQNKNEQLTEILEQAYFLALSDPKINFDRVYSCLKNLLTHYSLYNVTKGVAFAKMLMDEHDNEPIPITYLKDIYLQIGVCSN
jgi:hypothetical protein